MTLTVSAVEALPLSFWYVDKCSSRNLSCWYMFYFLMSSQHWKLVIKWTVWVCVFIVALSGYSQLCTKTLLIKQKFYFHTWFNCKKCYFCILNIAFTISELYLYNIILWLVLYVLCYLCLCTVFRRCYSSEHLELNSAC
jgi:hypothetical protein